MTDIDPAARRANYALLILCLVAMCNYIDRQILTILLESVKQDLGVSDAAMGLLTGTTFSIFYAAASYPLSRAADRGVRRTVLAWAVGVWSLLTALCGFAQSYLHLALARGGVAAAESAAVPVSHALLSDLFPATRRATVFGILMAAGSIGIATGLFLGGWINQHYGWRAAFLIVGTPGIIVALLLRFTVAEPSRSVGGAGDNDADAAALLSSPLYRMLLLTAAIGGTTTYSMLAWSPTFLIRVHDLSTGMVGLLLGLTTAVAHTLGHFSAGFVSDRLAQRGQHWYALVPAIGSLLAVPAGLGFLLAGPLVAAIASYAVLSFLMSAWLTPTYALAFRIAATGARARASALITATMVLVGLGVGPLLVGLLNDRLAPDYGVDAIRVSLLAIVALMGVLGLVYLFVARLAAAKQTSCAPPLGARPDSVTG